MGVSPAASYRALLDADRVDVADSPLQHDPGQRAPRRTRDQHAGPEIETSFMARTEETAFLRPRNDRAGKMRALLVERHEVIDREPHQQTGLVLVGKSERDTAADRDVVDRGDPPQRRLATVAA